MKFTDIKDEKALKGLSKDLIEGKNCEMTGHLISRDEFLGRSLMVDLTSSGKSGSNVRSVDHRTIDYLIYKNVKYSVGKKSDGEVPVKHDSKLPRWNSSKLAVGNWFSQSVYYKVKEIVDKDNVSVKTSTSDAQLTLSKDILVTEMNSGSAFASTEKVSRTDMIEKILDAKESVMTIKFHKKLDDAWVREILTGNIKNQKQLGDAKLVKQVAKELVGGKDVEMTCHLSGGESTLGRSLILDLGSKAGMNFRQVDHRTVEELIIQNKKYVLK